MSYCPQCGSPASIKPIDGRERAVCSRCAFVLYENPKILVACVIESRKSILMCRRAHSPSKGLWTPPAGFMELGETLEEAAARETVEECGVEIPPDRLLLYSITSLPLLGEVYVCFRTSWDVSTYSPGPESLEVAMFDEEAMPWDTLAFPEMRGFLRLFFAEQKQGAFSVHVSQARPGSRSRRSLPVRSEHD